MKKKLLFLIIALSIHTVSCADTATSRTENYFNSIQNNPAELSKFLKAMPKGGDLHMHESGSTFAENMLTYAAKDNLCINRKTYSVFINPACKSEDLLTTAILNTDFYNTLIDAWSMRNFVSTGPRSGHDHFFDTFGKYSPIAKLHYGEILAEIADRAASQNELYVEIMQTPDGSEASSLGKKLGWNPDFTLMREKLLAANFNEILTHISKNLTADENKMRQTLACQTDQAKPACHIKVRYLYQILREQPPEMVFAQLLAGFEAASKDPRIVGLNMVQPEDGPISMRDYKLQMQMVGFLHHLYPNVSVSLHAGELNDSLVPHEGLTFHIHDAVKVATANRIGHGADIAEETNATELLQEMAEKHVMVEINLSSNAYILNMKGKNHPLPLYLNYGVPVALSTDDEGVSRENLTKQYERAVTDHGLSYGTLKMMVRNSLTYAFLPGSSLWQDDHYQRVVPECAKDTLGSDHLTASCQAFLVSSEKAGMQWELEKRFNTFESEY